MPLNAEALIVGATDLLILIRVKLLQLKNARDSIEVTEFPIVKVPLKPEQN